MSLSTGLAAMAHDWRAALGADRGRLMSQRIAESTIAGLAGLAVAAAGLHALRQYAPSVFERAPALDRIGIDAGVAAFAVILSMLTGALCGLAPAWRVTRSRMSSSLSEMRGFEASHVLTFRVTPVAASLWPARWASTRSGR